MKAVATSSSLELGIDIGHINLVIQLGSPKSTARGLQRIGRAGHAIGMVTRGRFIALEIDELIECCTIAKNIRKSKMDDISIPFMCQDVLSQAIIGMSLEGEKSPEKMFEVVSGSAPFHNITKERFHNILDFLSTEELIKYRIYPKIRYSEKQLIAMKQLARMIYFLNVGTIPPQMEYKVRRAEDGSYIGTLSDSFVEKLTRNDVFLLGGRSYQFVKTVGTMVYVKHAGGISPTLPSWSGEFFSRTTDLSIDVGRFLSTLEASLLEKGYDRRLVKELAIPHSEMGKKQMHRFKKIYDAEIMKNLHDRFTLSEKGARLLLQYVFLQLTQSFVLPSGRKILIEGYIDNLRMKNIIIHSIFGRKVNEPIARALASTLTSKYGGRVKYSIHDRGIMLTLEEVRSFELYEIFNMIHSGNIEEILREELRDSDLFKRRFLHCANRGFTILKNYKGYEISIKKQQRQAVDILNDVPVNTLLKMPVYQEAYNEVLNQYMDLEAAKRVLDNIARGKILLFVKNFSTRPSIFSHSLIVTSLTDISSLASKIMVFKQLGGELFEEIIGYGSSSGVDRFTARFTRDMLVDHFHRDASYYKNLKKFQKGAKSEFSSVLERIESGEIGDRRVPLSRVDALKKIIVDFLREFGPYTHRELEAHLSFAIKNINLQSVLSELEKEANVIRDQLIEGEKHDYYILRRDYRSLRLKSEGNFLLTAEEFNNFAYRKFFAPRGEFNDLLAKGEIIGSPLDIFQRTKRYTRSKWISAIKEGELLQVRFIRSRMYFIPRSRISEFIWVRRTSSLNAVEQALLKYIMQNPGVKRSKIYKDLIHNRAQIFEALYRLEKNLWLARTHLLSADKESAVGFVYIPNEDFDDVFFKEGEEYENFDPKSVKSDIEECKKNSWENIIHYLLSVFGPMTKSTLQDYSWLFGAELDQILEELSSSGKVRHIFVENPYPTEMLITTQDFEDIENERETPVKRAHFTQIISDTHPYFHMVMHKAFLRFTSVWTHLLIDGNEPLAAVRLERKKDFIRILNVEMISEDNEKRMIFRGDDAAPLPEEDADSHHTISLLAKELEKMLKFYSNFDIDVIKIENINEIPIDRLGDEYGWITRAFEKSGLVLMEDMLVMGNLLEKSYPFDKVIKYVLYKQHLHPDNVYSNPRSLIDDFKTVSCTPEIQLRTSNDTLTLNAYAKNYDLVKAILVPSRQMFTTRDMIRQYKIMMKRRISPTAKFLLDLIPTGFVVSDKKWFARTDMGKSLYLEKKKELIDALYVVKDAKNSYIRVEDPVGISKKEARRQCIMNIFGNFGVFTLPRLKQYVGPEFTLDELREIVNKLVTKGYLVKGYLIKDSREIHYIMKEDVELLDEVQTYKKFILPPKDPMWYYLQDDIRKKFGKGDWYVILKGGEMAAAFKGKKGDEVFRVDKYAGEERYKFMAERWIWRQGLDVKGLSDKEEEEGEEE